MSRRGAFLALLLAACSAGPAPKAASPEPSSSVTASTAPATTTPPPPPGALETKESKALARTLARVSQLRGIRATRTVPGVKLERDQLVARVKDKALREYPADALRREGQLLQMFGFAPIRFDYLGEMMKLLEAQLEGFYEPVDGTMYLAADLRGKEAQATLAHELVHALQDQTWDLKSRSTYRPGKGDESLALACLAEGDATSLMMDYVMAEQHRTALDIPEPMLREMMESGIQSGDAIKTVPHILRTTLIAPYIDGLGFVHALRRKGGWAKVDSAWGKPPTTTEQVLHLEKWEVNEAPIPLAPPVLSAALGSGWKLEDEDTFGELGFALTFEEWVDSADARAAAAGWGGDRSAVWVRGDEIAFAVRERYDAGPRPNAFAERALAKLGPGLRRKLGKPVVDDPNTLCFDRKDLGPLVVARQGRDLVMTAGPARVAGGTWSATSTCVEARKWADEILAMR